ncbi:carbon monoxide dehydrogenase subunit G [Roseomonas sp. SSH11]|uniref:Carbon monoxide dehydrogenase subunit G n=1 Tax=Pararoseomonas baculiformis TaxID=2820812 RepID=A0ABS4AAQ3_9PROT|nr:carbon monoxide dehydrogenase subunit G [Pararoseomonas baculiformis]MBP0443936.1 carbon monoxide dehydrogenase subunit G [Pararoseomonas baculiformis]
MDMTGSRRIEAPRERVWEALNDPAMLQAAIPGCESVERTGPDSFQARVAVRIGPMSAKFGGKVTLTNIRPPEGYTITGEGQGGAMGFARGGADVSLVEESPGVTLLNYDVKAQVGGKMAQLGARLVDSTARQMADQFFDRFAAQLATAPVTETETMASNDTVPTTPGAIGSNGQPVTERRTATAALRPGQAKGGLMDLLMAIPREPYGMPITFWLGSAVMLVILALLFVIG